MIPSPAPDAAGEAAQEPAIDYGEAGASARRECERRAAKDEARLRAAWGPFGGIGVALASERQSTSAWSRGATGEQRVGERLDALRSEGIITLHDRRIDGGSLSIIDSLFEGTSSRSLYPMSFSYGMGGAVYVNGAELVTVIDSTFIDNEAGHSGGALYVGEGVRATVTGSSFLGNYAPDGGAIHAEDAELDVTNSTFWATPPAAETPCTRSARPCA